MMPFLRGPLVAAIAASLLLPATAVAERAGAKSRPRIVVHPKARWHGYGFLPGYRQPPYIAEWRDRRVDRSDPNELRYWYYGEPSYGWGGPGFYRGRWNGGSFGPCWTWTPIGMIWNCGT